jgi:hypothetical protein
VNDPPAGEPSAACILEAVISTGEMAKELGLAVYRRPYWSTNESFARLQRRLVPSAPTGNDDCLAGVWSGCNVVLIRRLHHADSFFMSHDTQVIAAIDPPLLLELLVENNTIRARDDRVLERVAKSAEDGIREARRGAARGETIATGSFVCVMVRSWMDYADLHVARLDRAVALATALGSELADLHESEWHQQIRTAWRSAADMYRLGFDADRFAITGMLAAAEIRVALEAEPEMIATTLVLRLPPGASFGFALRPQRGVFLFDRLLPWEDLRVGDRAFDDMFIVRSPDRAAA